MSKKRRRRNYTVHRLNIVILEDSEFEKRYANARKCHAMWDSHSSSILLRRSRRGLRGFADFIHECKHVWVDVVDDEG